MNKPPKSKPLLQTEKPVRSRPRKRRNPAQPNLALDPMPARIEPCLALLKPKVPKGSDWVYEIKLDGYRLAVHIEPKRVRIITRGGHDWTHRFPAIEEAAKQLGVNAAILDGEAVVFDEQGGPISAYYRIHLVAGEGSEPLTKPPSLPLTFSTSTATV
jgi:bifunctional non-homologous end joining protein LigD